MPIIISELHLFQVQRELFLGDSMELHDSLFGITPESLKAINVYFSGRESSFMVDSQMTISTKHKGIITPKFIGIDNRSTSYCFNGHIHKRLSRNIPNDFNPNRSVSLVNTEYRHFPCCSPSSLSLAPPPKVAFIKFNLSFKKTIRVLGCQDRQSNNSYGFQHRRITQSDLLSNLPSRQFNFKEFYDPKPFLKRYIKFINPSARKVMKPETTTFASVPFIRNSIDFIASTGCAKNTSFFPALFPEKKPSSVFRFRNKFKCFEVH